MARFGRNYLLEIETRDGMILKIEPPVSISFTINRSVNSSLNQMNMKIHNLAPDTRDRIFQDRINPGVYKSVILRAGYDNLTTIFRGNLLQAYSQREGRVDVVTSIVAQDGGRDYVTSYSSVSLREGTSWNDAVNELTKDFTRIRNGQIDLGDGVFRRPVVLEGNTFQLIKKYTEGQVFIDLETLNVLRQNGVLVGDVPLLSSSTGLIGTPIRQDSKLFVKTIFFPNIIVGQIVDIRSRIQRQFNGQYKVLGLKHTATISEAISGQAETVLECSVSGLLP